ncbi:hypothetical protein INR49_021898 [Caranx melampygus]|nr:hypothetical protein INR49_021898 [Caranx melampygus]
MKLEGNMLALVCVCVVSELSHTGAPSLDSDLLQEDRKCLVDCERQEVHTATISDQQPERRVDSCVVAHTMEEYNSGEEVMFNADDTSVTVKECIEGVIGGTDYNQSKVNQWTASIVEHSLAHLVKQGRAFKYMVNCAIMQKSGAGLHTANSCYWDNATDGMSSVVSLAVSRAPSLAASVRTDGLGGSRTPFPIGLFCGEVELHIRQRREEQFQRPWVMLEEKSLRHG